jgi:hypothetical protein
VNVLSSSHRSRGTFTCKYLSFFDPKLKKTFRLPLVHIRLKHKENAIRTDALIDSGATGTFIPIELTEVLELERPTETIDAVGAGGTFPTFVTKIGEIQVLKGSRIFCKMSNFTVSIPIDPDALPHTVLGRDSVFWQNDITFRERRQHTIFRSPKSSSKQRH